MKHLILATTAASLLFHATAFAQGSLSPTGAPAPTMKSLQQIWDKVGALEGTVNSMSSTLTSQQSLIQSQQEQLNAQAAMLYLANAANENSLPWIAKTVDSAGDVGLRPSLAYSPTGLPGISYYDSTNSALKYASYDGVAWTTMTVNNATSMGSYSSLVFLEGRPAIAYYSAGTSSLKYAEYNGATWTNYTVDNSASVGKYCSLALDSNFVPCISYYDETNGNLKFAKLVSRVLGGSWDVTTVDANAADTGRNTSLKFTPGGQPAIAYLDASFNYLYYAEYSGTSWSATHVSTSTAVRGPVSLAFSPAGFPNIAYCDTGYDVLVVKKSGSGWGTAATIVNSIGEWVSLTFTRTGRIAVATGLAVGSPNFIEDSGTGWVQTAVDYLSAGQYHSLKFSPHGLPGMAYYDTANGDLKYATKAPFVAE